MSVKYTYLTAELLNFEGGSEVRLIYHEAETLEAAYDAVDGEEVEDKIDQGKQAKQARRRQKWELWLR